ncbi:MAG: glycosyltransferase [Pirellulaceae bacterium]|jgi:glycosyltransferase involved in cell wall biosynthesis|nr:glycosyltransferase [Thermoguttaceae bacterium]NLZ02689.1 glycosyltransferase [Pirellulaceae bacterium]
MPPIRLALCITDLDVGGAERCLEELVIGVDRRRFSPVVYCLAPRPQNDEASCGAPVERAGIAVHYLGARHLWSLPRVIRDLSERLRRQNPQVIQTFLFHANIVGRLAARRAGVPCVVSGVRVAEHRARWHLWVERWTRNLVDRHVCVSRAVADFTARNTGIDNNRLVVIPNGIDVDRLRAVKAASLAEYGIAAGRRAVTFVGRLDPQKGLSWLLDTAVEWLPRLASHDLLLVGHGRQRAALERQAVRLGIGGRVRFAGWRPNVAEILAASDLLVLPSRWEGMPNVVLQAMALGLPVLATDVEGTRELLGPAAAQTVAYGDTPTFVNRLVTLIEDRRSGAELGLENRQRAASEFSLGAMIAAYQRLWESLAGG